MSPHCLKSSAVWVSFRVKFKVLMVICKAIWSGSLDLSDFMTHVLLYSLYLALCHWHLLCSLSGILFLLAALWPSSLTSF